MKIKLPIFIHLTTILTRYLKHLKIVCLMNRIIFLLMIKVIKGSSIRVPIHIGWLTKKILSKVGITTWRESGLERRWVKCSIIRFFIKIKIIVYKHSVIESKTKNLNFRSFYLYEASKTFQENQKHTIFHEKRKVKKSPRTNSSIWTFQNSRVILK